METPRQHKIALKTRLENVLMRLPGYFVNTFIHVFPEYTEQRKHVYNVANARSLDENVITRFEQLADLLDSKKQTA